MKISFFLTSMTTCASPLCALRPFKQKTKNKTPKNNVNDLSFIDFTCTKYDYMYIPPRSVKAYDSKLYVACSNLDSVLLFNFLDKFYTCI